MLIFKY